MINIHIQFSIAQKFVKQKLKFLSLYFILEAKNLDQLNISHARKFTDILSLRKPSWIQPNIMNKFNASTVKYLTFDNCRG